MLTLHSDFTSPIRHDAMNTPSVRFNPRDRSRSNGAFIERMCGQFSALLLFALMAVVPALAQSLEGTVALQRHTPPQVLDGRASLAGHYEPGRMLRLAIAVTPPHLEAEERFIRELTTPGSPNFHAFLSAEEWNARFAPSAADEQKIVDWAKSQGFKVTARFPSRLDIDLEAPAGVIEKAFGVTINNYKVNDEVDFSNDRDPVIPASLAGTITAVLGLNNIQRMTASTPGDRTAKGEDYAAGPIRVETKAIQTEGDRTELPTNAEASPESTNGFLDPTDIYSAGAYDFSALRALNHCCNPHGISGGTPAITSIAIAAFGNVNQADIAGFQKQYPYLATNVSTIQIDGAIACPSNDPGCYNYSKEATLDAEWATAASNSFGSSSNTAHVYVYEGNDGFASFYDLYNHALNDNLARVLSTGWGCPEIYSCPTSFMSGAHAIFNNLVGQGWTLIAASGDHGSSADCTHLSPSFPGTDPDFVSTGGTKLELALPTDNFISEAGWQGSQTPGACVAFEGGSGGGVSAYYAKPAWQGTLPGSGRMVPDVALNASVSQNYYFDGALTSATGDGMAAAELAGFFAQENAYLAFLGNQCGPSFDLPCAPVGPPNALLYTQALNPNQTWHTPFYDVTTGCNSNDVTIAGDIPFYCAGTGYDQVTGWGSINALQLAWDLNWRILNNDEGAWVTFQGPPAGNFSSKWYNTPKVVSWRINDASDNGLDRNVSGIAGFTAGWDAIPSDPALGNRGNLGNSYFNGPQYPNRATGCLSFDSGASGCLPGGFASQGCHNATVHGWNNEGVTTAQVQGFPETFTICYDTIPPVTTLAKSANPNGAGWYNHPVQVSFTARDPGSSTGTGSGVQQIYYSLNPNCKPASIFVGGVCVYYENPATMSAQGRNTLYYFSVDKANNFSLVQSAPMNIDTTPPVTAYSLSGTKSGGVYKGAVKVTLKATDKLSGVYSTVYQVSAGSVVDPVTIYTKPFNVAWNGPITITFHSTDHAGNVETTHTLIVNDKP